MQFGRSSERLARHIEQLELRLEELEAGEAGEISKAAAEDRGGQLFCVSRSRETLYVVEWITEYGTSDQGRAH